MADDQATAEAEVTTDYIKSNLFRVVHVNGALGGITPRLEIAISLYSERTPIPQQMVYAVTPDGQLGAENLEKRVQREAFVREVEVCAQMNYSTAKSFSDWLQKHVTDLGEILKAKQRSSEAESK